MDRSELISILDSIDASRAYTYFKSKEQGIEVWIVTDFVADKRTFMSKEKAQTVVRDLNAKIALAEKAVNAYAKALVS
jgi:hypothetical protein